MRITWLGHSALKIEASQTVYIDPFLTGNPLASVSKDEIKDADIVIVTHDHADHIGDSFAICKNTGATLVSFYEIAEQAAAQGISTESMNIGGTVKTGNCNVSMVPAFHTGGLGGTAVGIVVEMDQKSVYHAGDTGLSMEMQLIGEMYNPDIAFLPIDGRFNMTPRLAAKAAELLKVSIVSPVHYNTFPPISQDPEEFRKLAEKYCKVIITNPGEHIEI